MFGLENKSSGDGIPDQEFELEEKVKDMSQRKAILDGIREQMQSIKKMLQGGKSEEDFQNLGLVLHGYVAALKVIDRVKPK